MQNKTKTQPQKPFVWGVSSESINFMHLSELQAARDGSTGGDCGCGSNVSPLNEPKQKTSKSKPRK